ncbi:OLC1v1020809C1 [Oldenlandia corymbosa var. corymbosa]|uniref:OLC1v1020809C1 n=1 Tax=Oldenlandia corymbosa var. corymbosa TaxID=529605 RepID=A0AAV1BUV6_OLDCO|nr:OLC1v1020809C1 [Oldenlandia corymbosa var. corymbosa]
MASDHEIAKGVETLLMSLDPNAVTSLDGVVKQLQEKLGFDLSHRYDFIRDQINYHYHRQQQHRHHHQQQQQQLLLLRQSQQQQQQQQQQLLQQEDRFVLHNFPQYPISPQFQPQHQQQQLPHPYYTFLQQQQQHQQPPQPQPQPIPQPQPPQAQGQGRRPRGRPPGPSKKESNPSGTKRKGGSGGLNKVCGVSPELQVVVGKAALPRTEIVKQLWVYIREHNLQDPGNKRRIICDEALRSVFETDCTDMFKMNKLLAKHITSLDPTKEAGEVKRLKVEHKSETETSEVNEPPVVISDALADFFGTGEREMLQSEALRRLWDYIKINNLEDPLNTTVILCDAKLQELFGCESVSASGIPEMLANHHMFRQ